MTLFEYGRCIAFGFRACMHYICRLVPGGKK